MRVRMLIIAVVAIVAAVLGVGAVAGAAPAKAKAVSGNYAGTVKESNAYVAVVADKADKNGAKRDVVAYVCDSAGIAQWFEGRVSGNTFTLTAQDDARLQVKLGKRAAKGTFQAAGGDDKLAYRAAAVNEPAGLYRADETLGGAEYVGGWIVLPDGTQRGAIKGPGASLTGVIDPSNPVVQVPGIGSLTAGYVDNATHEAR